MSYSRRQLYALGETLGDSVTVKKVGGGRIYGGGGGGGSPAPSGPTQTNVMNTNIPEYAQPYVENMLNAAQAQIYNPDMTGFNAYTPYSNDPTKYVAGFSPLQQQAQSSAANLQTPGTFGAAQQVTGYGIGNALGLGMGATPQGFQNQVGGYMNPYLQNALNPALQEIGRQYDITGTKEMSDATRSGAFGGSREALMAAENQRNKNMAMNQVIGQGYNQAFNAAQNQYNANQGFGLQANQAAMQNAAQLAGLGGQELAAQQSIIGTQAQQGALEQNQQQNVINQAVQNYATAQQYPFLQLGMLNSMLRGLPMQQSTTQMYQAAPNQMSQLAGLGTAGLGAAAMYNAATRSADGGVIKMAPGGTVPMKMYTDQQLRNVPKSPASSPMADIYAQGLMQERAYNRGNPQAAPQAASLNQPMQSAGLPMPQDVNQRAGLAGAPTGNMTQMAEGGIASFADEGEVPKPDASKEALDALSKSGPYGKAAAALYAQNRPESLALQKEKEELKQSIAEQKGMINPSLLTRFGLNMMNAPAGQAGSGLSQFLANTGRSGLAALTPYERDVSAITQLKRQLAQMDAQGVSADNKNRQALAGELFKLQASTDMKAAQLASAGATRGQTDLTRQRLERDDAQTAYNQLLNRAMAELRESAKIGSPNYKRYKENPDLLRSDAEDYAMKNINPTYRDILKLNPNLPPVVVDPNAGKGKPAKAQNVINLD